MFFCCLVKQKRHLSFSMKGKSMVTEFVTLLRDQICFSPIYLGFIAGVAVIVTVALNFVQVRYFCKSWKLALGGGDKTATKGDMTAFQAFLNALNVGIGNGCLAGVATAIHAGGPGAAFWMFVAGILEMALRFAEVFLSVSFSTLARTKTTTVLGGPFLYIDKIPFGKVMAVIYAAACLFYGLVSGNAMQCNSISNTIQHSTGLSAWVIAVALTAFVLYVMFGGSQRIIKVSEAIIPFKVGLFFTTILIVLGYYWAEIIPAFQLIFASAFNPQAVMGAGIGLTVRHVISMSISRTVNACEAGLGTAAIFYGNTGSSNPRNDGITGMLSTFMSINVVAMLVSLALIVSGVWNTVGADGAVLVAQSYESVFGVAGGYIVTILSMIFGLGVFVPYCYVTRQCWLYLTGGRFGHVFTFVFAGVACLGALMQVALVWTLVDLAVACLLIINLTAILFLLPYLRSQLFAKNS